MVFLWFPLDFHLTSTAIHRFWAPALRGLRPRSGGSRGPGAGAVSGATRIDPADVHGGGQDARSNGGRELDQWVEAPQMVG